MLRCLQRLPAPMPPRAVVHGAADAALASFRAVRIEVEILFGVFVSSPAVRSFCVAVASLLAHVTVIIRERSEKQMRGVTARRIIAGVADRHSLWNRAVTKIKSDAMCESGSAFSWSESNLSVSLFVAVSSPHKAIAAWFKPFIEPLDEMFAEFWDWAHRISTFEGCLRYSCIPILQRDQECRMRRDSQRGRAGLEQS